MISQTMGTLGPVRVNDLISHSLWNNFVLLLFQWCCYTLSIDLWFLEVLLVSRTNFISHSLWNHTLFGFLFARWICSAFWIYLWFVWYFFVSRKNGISRSLWNHSCLWFFFACSMDLMGNMLISPLRISWSTSWSFEPMDFSFQISQYRINTKRWPQRGGVLMYIY